MESLFLNLCLITLVPQITGDKQVVIETLEDIEELKECYTNLGIDKVPESSAKKAKKSSEDMSAKKEA